MVSANELFAGYLSDALGEDNAGIAIAALEEPASVSVRWNPSKLPADIHDRISDLVRVPWSEYGMMLDSRPVFTLDPLFHAGCYYVQDSSAMYPGYLLRSVIGAVELPSAVRVLDLCAAPGGKTTDAAASLRSAFGDGFLLVSNEVVRSRASVLASNVAVWGDPCVAVCSADPAGFGNLKGFFDSIPTELYEAADIDGAGPLTVFWRIELPLIMTQVRINLILMVIGTVQSWENIYLFLGVDGRALWERIRRLEGGEE